MDKKTFRAFRVEEDETGKFVRSIVERKIEDLPAGDVLVNVHFAGLNYKDALSATGNKGVTRKYPHTPGIDGAGTVVESKSPHFNTGDEVVVTSYDLGMNTYGGFAEYIRVPAEWVIPLPKALTLRESMILGTAGFTAGLSLYYLLRGGARPSNGPIVVTGASGGVGSLAVALLAQNGFDVVAVTGKKEAHGMLSKLGAKEIIDRKAVDDESGRPMLKAQFAGAIDTVGGNMLATILKSTGPYGVVTCCGLVQSHKLETSVFPFILRGISLVGVDSQNTPREIRYKVWEHLATDWKLEGLEDLAEEVDLHGLNEKVDLILDGKVQGRILVKP